MILDSPIISGSSTVTGNLTVLGTLTANVSGSVTSASYATNAETLDGLDSTSFTTTSSFTAYTASTNASILSNIQNIAILYVSSSLLDSRVTKTEATASSLTTASSSFSTRVSASEASISILTTASSSFSTRTTNLETASGSFSTRTTNLETASGSFSTRVTNAESSITSLNSRSGSFATTGSNTFIGTQTITGSLFITENLTVLGSSSISYVSQSTLNIGTNLITVNAQNPSIRFGGLAVIDSGSSPQVSGSWLFDSIQDRWIMIHQQTAGSALTSSIAIMGPETYNDLGNETTITLNRLVKGSSGASGEHIGNSNISDTGTVVSINSATQITGSLGVTGASTFASSVTADSLNINTSTVFVKASIADTLTATSIGSNYNPGILNIQNKSATNGNLSLIGFQDASQFINLAAMGSINETHAGSPNSVTGALAFYTKTSGTGFISERMRITSAGNVGIGTITPARIFTIFGGANTSRIILQNTATGQAINNGFDITMDGTDAQVWNYQNGSLQFATVNSERMRITAAGRVGIGNTAPVSALVVSTTSNTSSIGQSGIVIEGASTLTAGDIMALAFTAIPGTTRARAAVGSIVGSDWGKGNLVFYTRDASDASALTTADERMRITSAGNVGIGTTDTQTFRLAVDGPNVGQGDTTTTIRVFDTTSATTGTGGGISFGGYFSGTSSVINTFSYIKGGKENSTSGNYASYLSFGTRVDGGSVTERLRIASTGEAVFSGKTNIVKAISDYAFTVVNTDSNGYGMYIQAGSTNNAIDVYNAAGTTQLFKLTGAGAATFSANVYAPIFTSTGGRGTNYGFRLPDWQIYNTSSGNALAFNNYTTDFLYINSSGNVGIGTTSPSNYLTIGQNTAGDETAYSLAVLRSGTTSSPGTWKSTPAISITDISGDGPSSVSNTNALLQLNLPRVGDIDTYSNNAFFINCVNDNGSAFVVTGQRNVGIGTTSPSQKLEVVGGEIKAGRVDSSNEGGQISFGRASDNATGYYIDVYGSTSTPDLRFVDVTNSSVRMTINSGGDLLLKTTSTTATADAIFQFGNGGVNLFKQATLANNQTMDIRIGSSNVCYWGGFLSVLCSDLSNGGARTQTNFSILAENQFATFSTFVIHTVNGSLGGRSFTITYVGSGIIRLTNTSGETCVCTMTFFGGGANLG